MVESIFFNPWMHELVVAYFAVTGVWLFSCALSLSLAWGDTKLTRPLARALILTPVWPVVALWALKPISVSVWRAAEWGRK